MSPLEPKSRKIPRRDFLKAVPVAAGVLVGSSKVAASFGFAPKARSAAANPSDSSSRLRIEAFDYQGVKLRDSRWQTQVQTARDYYLNVSSDDILCGFRAAAGL